MKALMDRTILAPDLERNGLFMDARGRSRGLALLWVEDVTASLLSQSLHHINVEVHLQRDMVLWRFTRIYGWLETHLKVKTYTLISDLKSASSLSWIICGDFKEIFITIRRKADL